jgi:hypothetical protein
VVQEIREGQIFRRRRQLKPESSKSMRRQDFKELLHLRNGRKPPTVSEDGAEAATTGKYVKE